MLKCKDATRLVSLRSEQKLSRHERMSLALHLWMCSSCRRFERQLGLLRRLLQRIGREDAQDPLSAIHLTATARKRISDRIEQEKNQNR